ncbi:unnamed protein product [Cyclocybe aegerita]|uniref:F-box domain-containing protein n=1 Tax=Cyclocybe aegerita TaxID=1973307 RepID=A0A8S0VWT3_CYCAE|nr:unnamed protein product [Cyclocybe aegerita]
MILVKSPFETLDLIASAIESPADLRNLGATCKLLHFVVSPSHTQYREIRAPLLSPVWRALTENCSLAQNVRVVEVQSTQVRQFPDRVDGPIVPVAFLESIVKQEPKEKGKDRVISAEDPRTANNAVDLAAGRIFVVALKAMVNLILFRWTEKHVTRPSKHADSKEALEAGLMSCRSP